MARKSCILKTLAVLVLAVLVHGKADFDTLEVLETVDFGDPVQRFHQQRPTKPKIDPSARKMLEAFVGDTEFHTLKKLEEIDFKDGKPVRTKIFARPRVLVMKHWKRPTRRERPTNFGRALNELVLGHPLLMVFKRK